MQTLTTPEITEKSEVTGHTRQYKRDTLKRLKEDIDRGFSNVEKKLGRHIRVERFALPPTSELEAFLSQFDN